MVPFVQELLVKQRSNEPDVPTAATAQKRSCHSAGRMLDETHRASPDSESLKRTSHMKTQNSAMTTGGRSSGTAAAPIALRDQDQDSKILSFFPMPSLVCTTLPNPVDLLALLSKTGHSDPAVWFLLPVTAALLFSIHDLLCCRSHQTSLGAEGLRR